MSAQGAYMGILDYFKKRTKDKMCPECEKTQKHVKMIESEGRLECPECHFIQRTRH